MDVQDPMLPAMLGQRDLRKVHRREGRPVVVVLDELLGHLDPDEG